MNKKATLPEATRTPQPQFFDERAVSNRDVFLIPCLDGFLLYNPITMQIALVSEAGGTTIRRYLTGQALSTEDVQIIKEFESLNYFGKSEESVNRPLSEQWAPTSVTFSTTQKCTLRCKYCYADGGRLDDLDIPLHIAHAAIDLVVNNAVLFSQQPQMGFLGEGEATLSWTEFTDLIEYFRSRCLQVGLTGKVSLVTNGVFPANHASYIAANCDTIAISLDGLMAIHDASRILPNGRGSFDIVIARLRQLEELGASVSIRSTVSASGLDQVSEFVNFLGENTNVKHIHLEPVFDNSHIVRTAQDVGTPTSKDFIQAFGKARCVAAQYDIELYFAGAELGLYRDSFCGVGNASNFIVTTRGLVTSCNEVMQPWDPRAPLFQYGYWDEEEKRFVINNNRMHYLYGVNVSTMRRCDGCFAKYSCAGDCPARTFTTIGDVSSSDLYYTERCYIMRELIRDNLLMTLAAAKVQSRTSCPPIS